MLVFSVEFRNRSLAVLLLELVITPSWVGILVHSIILFNFSIKTDHQ